MLSSREAASPLLAAFSPRFKILSLPLKRLYVVSLHFKSSGLFILTGNVLIYIFSYEKGKEGWMYAV